MNDGLTCNTCGQNSVIQIELTLPDGSEVVFCSCHRCESKWLSLIHISEPTRPRLVSRMPSSA